MHPILERVAGAYRPLAGRNRLVEGHHRRPAAGREPRRRMILLVLVAALCGRRP